MCGVFEWTGSRIRCFIVKYQELFKYWQLLIIVGVHSIGWEGSNTALLVPSQARSLGIPSKGMKLAIVTQWARKLWGHHTY